MTINHAIANKYKQNSILPDIPLRPSVHLIISTPDSPVPAVMCGNRRENLIVTDDLQHVDCYWCKEYIKAHHAVGEPRHIFAYNRPAFKDKGIVLKPEWADPAKKK